MIPISSTFRPVRGLPIIPAGSRPRDQRVGSQGNPGMGRNDGAFRPKQEKNVVPFLAQRFKISLTLGQDQVGLGKTAPERFMTVMENGPRGVGTVVSGSWWPPSKSGGGNRSTARLTAAGASRQRVSKAIIALLNIGSTSSSHKVVVHHPVMAKAAAQYKKMENSV